MVLIGEARKNEYGSFKYPTSLIIGDSEISILEDEGFLYYTRISEDVEVKKILSSDDAEIVINPIEPVNLPKKISSHLLVDFESPLLISPTSNKIIYVTFPLEIGIFLQKKKSTFLIDIISLSRAKFTLYGTPSDGIICKYHKSTVYSEIPPLPSPETGVIELNIKNISGQIVEINKVVLNAYGMKIYYDDELVAMKANMEINDKKTAETKFFDLPLRPDMKKSKEVYSLNKVHIISTNYVMEKGI